MTYLVAYLLAFGLSHVAKPNTKIW